MRLPQGGPHRPCCISRCAPQRTDRRRRCARGSRLASGRDLPRCTWGTAAPTATASRPHARLEQRWSVRCGRGPGRTFWRGRSRPRRIVSSGETSACELGRGLSRQQAAGTSAGRPRGRQVNCTQQRAGGTSPLSLVLARRPATSEGSFRLVRLRSGRVGGVWAAFMCLHWRSVLSSGSLPAAPALEVGRQRNGRHFRVESAATGASRSRQGPTRGSHSVLAHLPLGASEVPLGASRAATGSVAPPHWHSQWTSPRPSGRASGTFKLRLEKRVGARGRGCLAPLGPSRVARRPRRVPLASARRPPRAPTGRPRHYRVRATSSGGPSYTVRKHHHRTAWVSLRQFVQSVPTSAWARPGNLINVRAT